MDPSSNTLFSPDEIDVATTFEQRKETINKVFEEKKFDAVIIEFYPFGRRKFRQEIKYLIESSKDHNSKVKVISSMRDIYIPKENHREEDKRIKILNQSLHSYFDKILVHSDKNLIQLENQFFLTKNNLEKIIYTGYVAPTSIENNTRRSDRVIVQFGASLATAGYRFQVLQQLGKLEQYTFDFYLGPHEDHFPRELSPNIEVHQHIEDFHLPLSKAKMAITMGGYNSIVEHIATKTPALIIPYDDNNEQSNRAKSFGQFFPILLANRNWSSDEWSKKMDQLLLKNPYKQSKFDFNGVKNTELFFKHLLNCPHKD